MDEWYHVYQVDGQKTTWVAIFRYPDDAYPFLREMAGSGYLSLKGIVLETKNLEI